MPKRDLEPIDVLDRASSLVGTEELHRKGVSNLRVLSESRFIELVRGLVEDSLREAIVDSDLSDVSDVSDETPSRDADGVTEPHDRRLTREYQRRWEALKRRHGAGLRQIERRMDRLARTFRELDRAVRRVEGSEAHAAAPDDVTLAAETPSPAAAPTDKTALLREMLLGDND